MFLDQKQKFIEQILLLLQLVSRSERLLREILCSSVPHARVLILFLVLRNAVGATRKRYFLMDLWEHIVLLNMPLFISKQKNQQWYVDLPLLLPVIALMSIGFIMVSSASFSFGDHRLGDELFFFKRHLAYLAMGLVTLMICFFTPSEFGLNMLDFGCSLLLFY